MTIDDEKKRQIMNELALGDPELLSQEQSEDQQNVDVNDYQNFDDFAQRSSRNQQQKLFKQPLRPEQMEFVLPSYIRERITTDINQAKEVGQLRAERIREIVQSTVFEVASELKSGSSDIRLIVKDAVSAAIGNLQGKGDEVKDEITASIEGAIEGITKWRRQSIAKTQKEVKQLQFKIDNEESELQQEIENLLSDIEQSGKDNPPSVKGSVEAAINALKNSEEVALMQKRYAQLQAQLAILRANLAARYGGQHEEVKGHLDEAKTWYNQSTQAEPLIDQALQKKEQLAEKLGDAGAAIAKKEGGIRQILSTLLIASGEILREKEPPVKK